MADPNGPVGSIDPTGMDIAFDPVLDDALGSFGEHRWEGQLEALCQKLGIPPSNTLEQVGAYLDGEGIYGADRKTYRQIVQDATHSYR